METISLIGSPYKFICRICHDRVQDAEGGRNVCRCSGSIKYVHLACLEKWLSVKNGKNDACECELCGTTFQVTKENPSFKQWITSKTLNKDQRWYIIYDILSLLLLTPLLILSFILCVLGSMHYNSAEKPVEANSLLGLAIFIICLYFLWIYLLIAHHSYEFKNWRNDNQIVKIVLPELNEIVSESK